MVKDMAKGFLPWEDLMCSEFSQLGHSRWGVWQHSGLPRALGNGTNVELDAGPAAGFWYNALCSCSPVTEITSLPSAQILHRETGPQAFVWGLQQRWGGCYFGLVSYTVSIPSSLLNPENPLHQASEGRDPAPRLCLDFSASFLSCLGMCHPIRPLLCQAADLFFLLHMLRVQNEKSDAICTLIGSAKSQSTAFQRA